MVLVDYLIKERGRFLSQVGQNLSKYVFQVLTRRTLDVIYPFEKNISWRYNIVEQDDEALISLCIASP